MSSRCKKCGRKLTDLQSIERGYGPKCYRDNVQGASGGGDPQQEEQISGQMDIFDFPDLIPEGRGERET